MTKNLTQNHHAKPIDAPSAPSSSDRPLLSEQEEQNYKAKRYVEISGNKIYIVETKRKTQTKMKSM